MTTQSLGRILIVDDDEAVRAAYERLLTKSGFEVRVVRSPYEGLEITREWTPDVILLDLVMPTISGFEAIKVFRKKVSTRDAVLVAFSAMIGQEEEGRLRRIGFDEVLPKPALGISLVERISQFLERRRPVAGA
jgi:DNA-binding response OmpR family regulator